MSDARRAGPASARAPRYGAATAPEAQPSGDVRRFVRGLLENTDSFQGLSPEERKQLAGSLVKVMSYLTDSSGGIGKDAAAAAGTPVRALDVGVNETLKNRLADDPKQVGADFKAGAAREGAEVFEDLVSAVDFPRFVSGLIEGVYTSIVTSSIRQMQAYGKLLEAVAKSAEEFARDNISVDAARSHVAASFPQAVIYDTSQPEPRLRLRDDVEDADQPDFKVALGMPENVALDDENETKIVLAAQLKMARQRQQQLALMLALGINRVIVTDGEIKASVLFDVKSHDIASRESKASTYDRTRSTRMEGGGWFSDGYPAETKVSTAWSEEKDRSSSELESRAKLSGNVTVRFRSETFPLERLASSDELGAVQEKSERRGPAGGSK